MFSLLADAVVVLHLAFIAFIVAGGLLALRWPRLAWLHLPVAAWGVLVHWMGWICPLTPLENWLRARAGAATYQRGFVEQYLVPVLYPASYGPRLSLALGAAVLAANALAYALVLWRARSRPSCRVP